MKQYDECNLLYPFKSTIIFVSKIICLFNNNIYNVLKKAPKVGVKIKMIELINLYITMKLDPDICLNCKFLLVVKIYNKFFHHKT